MTSCGSQPIRHEINDLVRKIEKYNVLESEHVGEAGETTDQYRNFIKLREKATIDELLFLLNHKNSVVKGYASWALADREYPKLNEVIKPFIDSGELVKSQDGCIGSTTELASTFYYRILDQRFYNKLTTKDSIFFSSQIQKIDSLIVFSDKNTTVLKEALEGNNANPNTYFRVKELALKKNKSAIIALAKYKKTEDIPILIQLGEDSFLAISSFPDKAFWNFLLKYKDSKRSLDFFLAVASFQNKEALELLANIYPTCDSIEINQLDESLIKNYCSKYQDLILKIWENSKTIDLTSTKKLIRDCPKKSSTSFAKGLSNKKTCNFLEIGYNYGTKDSIMPLMIENINKYNGNSLNEIWRKNIATAEYMELVSILDLIKNNHIIDAKQDLLNRLTIKNYPFEIFQISETLLSFKDYKTNIELLRILKENRDDWDRGNWSEEFRKLLTENKLKID